MIPRVGHKSLCRADNSGKLALKFFYFLEHILSVFSVYKKPLGVKSALFYSFYNLAHICADKFRNVATFFTQVGRQSQICFFHRQDCFEVFYQRNSRQKTALSSVADKTHIFDKFCQHSLRRTKLFSFALAEPYFVFQ